jgi:putative hemolysin
MKNMKTILGITIIIGLFVGAIFLSGCGENIKTTESAPICGVDEKTYESPSSKPKDVAIAYVGECNPKDDLRWRMQLENNNTQIANPASVYCQDNGGKLEIRTADDGSQTGYCILNNKECEEWSLMRGECTQIHVCTDKEKAAEICTMEYMGVCGNDKITYATICTACSSGKIKSLTIGEC